MERDHAKEKQKLSKDKDAGGSLHSHLGHGINGRSGISKGSIDEGQSDENEDGESSSGAAEGLVYTSNPLILSTSL